MISSLKIYSKLMIGRVILKLLNSRTASIIHIVDEKFVELMVLKCSLKIDGGGMNEFATRLDQG